MRVVLSGYYGFDNAGDEALLTAITSSLKKVNPHIEFIVLSANPDRTQMTHDLPAVSRVNPLVLIRELRRADLLISGGGSLLQDITGPFSLPYYLGIVFLAQLLGTPVVFYAQGVGPITRKLSKKMIRAVVNRVNLVTLRDQASQELLLKCGVTRPPLRVTADPVFVLEPGPAELERADAVLCGMGLRPDSNLIGVSVREWEQMNWEPGLARALDNLAAQGYQVVIVPLQYTSGYRAISSTGIFDGQPGPGSRGEPYFPGDHGSDFPLPPFDWNAVAFTDFRCLYRYTFYRYFL